MLPFYKSKRFLHRARLPFIHRVSLWVSLSFDYRRRTPGNRRSVFNVRPFRVIAVFRRFQRFLIFVRNVRCMEIETARILNSTRFSYPDPSERRIGRDVSEARNANLYSLFGMRRNARKGTQIIGCFPGTGRPASDGCAVSFLSTAREGTG